MRNRKAFTLLELVIVIIIVGVLTSLALPKMFRVIDQARLAEVYAQFSSIRLAMERHLLMNNGSFKDIHVGHPCFTSASFQDIDLQDPSTLPNAKFGYTINLMPDEKGTTGCPADEYYIVAYRLPYTAEDPNVPGLIYMYSMYNSKIGKRDVWYEGTGIYSHINTK